MKIAPGAILLIADGAKMLLLKNSGDAVYPILEVIAHRTIDNPPNREQLADAPGLSFSSSGSGRNTMQRSDPHQEREDTFAIEAAAALASVVHEQANDVIVVAPPSTLGVLRLHYDRATQKKLKVEIDKDLTKHPVSEIARLICAEQFSALG